MSKRIIILGVLSTLLIVLIFVKSQSTASPVAKLRDDSSEYTTVEYKISKIKGNEYFGKSENGTEIIFSAKNIVPGDEIEVGDVVLCYFEKGNFGKGIIKVEKNE